ncbi:Crp/Fnr family transcriptional regulator [Coleofasciculus sp. FACHB-64]|uniref:Crp/Fnr family transcriptional regulator n=2 Tax=Cyanophyceae TaxID=3028117 RepID=UPI001682F8B2|nr:MULTISPECIES: Crp/Fnr family transcriptional regulator [unclassified Coleofasciculus]MBD1841814.1 Crp/Fnr family transcriptional regulator [Coleofasciculus sp. FACHB-501]MBD1878059.1 Crp/Fnr family transcriptional regulator [Coleofasciculus sp. FACHB-T130]MBD1892143.1 Crp/Fnr family transcriptional regulator [Coleofasciculus sp. FACHB-SPT9]MBD2047717.1 Crp/Fnr family transcriptional regulator [Coleofasciculus sp. FACHB-64]MBD2087627.1 Crp/Fnr family transcriptional regulator [Coleofasciculu
MSVPKDPLQPIKNRLLAALPDEEYERLVPHLEPVSLPLNQVLYELGVPIEYVYFPQQGIVSLLSVLEDGSTVEAGMVGNDGMVGLPIILGGNKTSNRALVQVAGNGMRMKAEQLRSEFKRGGVLQSLLLRYTQALLTQVSQGVACNRLHTIEERLARWLLTVQDRVESDQFPLTQEFIAQMLGTRRSGVTVAAGTLSKAGTIRYSRGKITILNQGDLEAISCECYGIIKAEFGRLLGTEHR